MAENLNPGGFSRIDIAKIVAEIRARVKSELAQSRDSQPLYRPLQPDFNREASRRAGELVHSEELYYLNTHYTYGQLDLNSVVTHRRGFLGKLIVKFKRKILTIVWENFLRGYFEAEKEFQSRLVRYLNDVSKYVDARDAGNFWELIHKIDYDVGKALERIDRIADEQSALLHSSFKANLGDLHSSLDRIRSNMDQHGKLLQTLDSAVRGLEAIVAKRASKVDPAKEKGVDEDVQESRYPDYSYALFENRFRGSEAEIADRLSIYPDLFKYTAAVKQGADILDIGAGRGELLCLFKQRGISAYGVDNDPAMAALAGELGVRVKCDDAMKHLASLPDSSLGGVIAVQVVEHLSLAALKQLIESCAIKVKPSGRVIFETVNPTSLLALSSNFYRDPSHHAPLHPDTLSYLLSLAGLKVLEIRYLSAVDSASQLQYLTIDDGMTPRWVETCQKINSNLEQLNKIIYGYQDYCVIAEVS